MFRQKQTRLPTLLDTNRLEERLLSNLSNDISETPLHDENSKNAVVLCHVNKSCGKESLKFSESDTINSDNDNNELIDFRPQTDLDIEEYDIIDQVLQANRSAKDLESLRQHAINGDLEYEIRNGLL